MTVASGTGTSQSDETQHTAPRRLEAVRVDDPREAGTRDEVVEGTDRVEARPEADNLVGIYAALSGRPKADVLGEFGGAQFSGFKSNLVDLAVTKLSPIAVEMKRLTQDQAYVDQVLIDGAERANVIATETINAVKDIVGFIRKR